MEGWVPDAFKTAVVTHVIEKTNLPLDNNEELLPVSGLSFISKLVESLVAKQLLEHMHVHNDTSWPIKLVTQQTQLFSPSKNEVHFVKR